MRKKVVLGLSGGVDSSVSAALLKNQGYEVIGVTMNNIPDGDIYYEKACAISQAIEDARIVARDLGIEYHVIDLKEEFDRKIVDQFIKEYSLGYTPNPCIICNKYIKFGDLRDKTKGLNADYLATGHYAKIEFDKDKKRYLLKKAKDSKKDQTYFLYKLTQDVLKETIFPLGGFTKDEVRKIGEELGIKTHSKKDSEEICFISNDNHGSFIEKRNPELLGVGNFIDEEGNIIGKHKGIINYTLGQRRGLGIAFGERVYVSKINGLTKEITLSDENALYKNKIELVDYNLISIEDITEPIITTAKIRHGISEYKAEITKKDGKLYLEFEKPVRAPSKGQSAVLYDGDIVVGGGIINDAW